MSEHEYDGLTLEGLAQRLEALERREPGKDQTGEETAAEFVRPPSTGEREYAGPTLRGLAHRLALLESENALLRERELGEARDDSTFYEVQCSHLECRKTLKAVGVAVIYGRGLHSVIDRPGDHPLLGSGPVPISALTGYALRSGARGVLGIGNVGVWGDGARTSDEEPGIGVLGEGDDIGVKGKSVWTGVSGEGIATRVVGRSNEGYGVFGESGHRGVWGTSDSGTGVHGSAGGSFPAVSGFNAADATTNVNGSGPGVQGESVNGYGGRFVGGKAQLMLTPMEAVGKPTTGEHTKGEIYMDSEATLFVCTADGTPGTWKRFQTLPAP